MYNSITTGSTLYTIFVTKLKEEPNIKDALLYK